MAEAQTPAADRLQALRAAQGILSEAGARRSSGGGNASADARDDAHTHLDSFASASAGLMQLSSAAAAVPESGTPGGGSPGADESRRGPERPLPPGWNRITHGSGLPCYANYRLGVVCWSKPYAMGADAAQLPEPDFTRFVKKHVPPVGIFSPMGGRSPERSSASAAGAAVSAANSVSSSKSSPPRATQAKTGGVSVVRPGVAITGVAVTSSSATAAHPAQTVEEPSHTKKRKVEGADRTVHHSSRSSDKQVTMTLDEFKRLAIDDPRVLQACMELSVKTPAQVLQEYQNRNRGVSINYNTVPSEVDGVKLFKTIVTAGSTVAEGTASTKKIAKQLGAQQLLALLHERTARTYMQVAELYSSTIKGQPAIAETMAAAAASVPAPMPTVPSLSGQTISNSLRSVGTLGRIVDARFVHANTGGSSSSGGIHGLGVAPGGSGNSGADSGSRFRKFRRASPTREYEQYGRSYSDAADYASSNQWEGYQQDDGGSTWTRDGAAHVDSPGSERIVVYSSPSSGNTNYGSPYYSGGHAPWTYAPPGGLPLPPPPQQPSPSVAPPALPSGSGYAGRYTGDAEGGAGISSSRQYGYGAYRSRSSDRPTSAKQPQARYRSHPSE